MSKPNVLTIRIPGSLKLRIEKMAELQGVSINQLAMYMFTKEIMTMETETQLAERWKDFSKDQIYKAIDEVMSKVQSKEVPDWDRI